MKTKYRQSICLLLILSIINLSLTGCGGQNANPVARYLPGDEKKSLNALNAEIANIDNEIVIKKSSKTNRDIVNVICFAGGLFVVIPWFFMDFKGSQEIEIEALRVRKNALQNLCLEKENYADTGTIPEKTTVKKESGVYSIEVK